VLHTWTQDLRRHLHVHALMACGALRVQSGAAAWCTPKRGARFLFPVQALSAVFKGKFLQALQEALAAGSLWRDPMIAPLDRARRMRALQQHDWVTYAKAPMAGPAAVLDYLSRYTHRTAIGNERLLGIDGDTIALRVRADGHGGVQGGKRTISLPGSEFVARLLQHVLPAGFKRIRHFGLLAPAAKTQRLALARQLLAMPEPSPQAREDASAFMRRVAAIEIACCPHCKLGHWQLIREARADRAAWASMGPSACRGPP
jgi:hypothetical protein